MWGLHTTLSLRALEEIICWRRNPPTAGCQAPLEVTRSQDLCEAERNRSAPSTLREEEKVFRPQKTSPWSCRVKEHIQERA